MSFISHQAVWNEVQFSTLTLLTATITHESSSCCGLLEFPVSQWFCLFGSRYKIARKFQRERDTEHPRNHSNSLWESGGETLCWQSQAVSRLKHRPDVFNSWLYSEIGCKFELRSPSFTILVFVVTFRWVWYDNYFFLFRGKLSFQSELLRRR